jgi:AcrR family transcriptional regulator
MINTRVLQSSIRDRILSAAFQSLKDNGFSGTSTLEIATKAHVSKRELYTLFSSKDEILLACIAERASAISGSVSEQPEPGTAQERFGLLRELGLGFSRASHAPKFSLRTDSRSRGTMIFRRSRASIGMADARAARRLRQ